MRDLSLHLLDIIQNSISAKSSEIKIDIVTKSDDYIYFTIEDNGCGMDEELLKSASDPFTTTRKTRNIGLGIPLLKEACQIAQGDLNIISKKDVGTRVNGKMLISSIDRIPIGNIGETFMTLALAGNDINFILKLKNDDAEFFLAFDELRNELKDVPLYEISVASWIREIIEQEKQKIFGGTLDEIINSVR